MVNLMTMESPMKRAILMEKDIQMEMDIMETDIMEMDIMEMDIIMKRKMLQQEINNERMTSLDKEMIIYLQNNWIKFKYMFLFIFMSD